MANKVLFKTSKNLDLKTEFIKPNAEMLKESPSYFQNQRDGFGKICLNTSHLMFFLDEQPYFYYRHSNPDSNRFVGIIRLGDTPLDYQKGGYTRQLACSKKGDKFVAYHKVSDNPVHYAYYSEDKRMSTDYYEDHATVKEGDILQYDAYYFPLVAIDHLNAWPDISPYYCSVYAKGFYKGKPIEGIGRFDRNFMPKNEYNGVFHFDYPTLNINHELSGIREDNRREQCTIDITANGGVWAFYWLEGEEPVSSNEIEVEADWYKLPYLDDETCVFKDIVFRFAGKEIHVEGKWGNKGFTSYPRFDKKGQAELSGPWYEGKNKYKHKLYMSFNEVQECYAKNLIELGFNVYDEI